MRNLHKLTDAIPEKKSEKVDDGVREESSTSKSASAKTC